MKRRAFSCVFGVAVLCCAQTSEAQESASPPGLLRVQGTELPTMVMVSTPDSPSAREPQLLFHQLRNAITYAAQFERTDRWVMGTTSLLTALPLGITGSIVLASNNTAARPLGGVAVGGAAGLIVAGVVMLAVRSPNEAMADDISVMSARSDTALEELEARWRRAIDRERSTRRVMGGISIAVGAASFAGMVASFVSPRGAPISITTVSIYSMGMAFGALSVLSIGNAIVSFAAPGPTERAWKITHLSAGLPSLSFTPEGVHAGMTFTF